MRKTARNIVKSSSGNLIMAAGFIMLFALDACAPSSDFKTVPQKGAWRTGTYPDFSTRPRGETAQFSDSEQQNLSRVLQAEGRQARNAADNADKKQHSQPDAVSSQKQADQEIEKTLRQITGDR